MNTTFTNLFKIVKGRIFGELEVLNTDIPQDILKIIKVTRNKTLDGKMFSFKLNNDIDIYIIRELDSFIYADTLFVDSKRSVVCSIPYDLYNYEQETIVKIVSSLYTYICNQLILKPGDTIYNKIISMAPMVLTLHTLREVCEDLELDSFINEDDEFHDITKHALYESLSFSIEELLDYCGILAICQEKIKLEVEKQDESN